MFCNKLMYNIKKYGYKNVFYKSVLYLNVTLTRLSVSFTPLLSLLNSHHFSHTIHFNNTYLLPICYS